MPGAELTALFGDELPEVGSARIGMVLASGTKVSMRDVAQMLLAIAVAQLLDEGAATATETEIKKRLRTRRTLVLQANEAGEGMTAAVAAAARDGVPIDELAMRLLDGANAAPETSLIRLAQAQLEATGAVVQAKGAGRRFGKMLGANPYEIEPEQAEALRPQWQALMEQWSGWKAANPELAERILDGCKTALGNSRDTSD